MNEQPAPTVIYAFETSEPPVIDGKLDDSVWKMAQPYKLEIPRNISDAFPEPLSSVPIECGQFRVAYDKDNLYVSISFYDSDVEASVEENGLHHYSMGDVAEFFLWPESQTYYWELYATPKSMHTAFFYPGTGRLGSSGHFEDSFQFKKKNGL